MTQLSDLERIPEEAPRTFREWLNQFSQDDRELIIESIIIRNTDECYEVLADLDVHAFPFSRKSFVDFKRRVINNQEDFL